MVSGGFYNLLKATAPPLKMSSIDSLAYPEIHLWLETILEMVYQISLYTDHPAGIGLFALLKLILIA
jgi:hypothetical protein